MVYTPFLIDFNVNTNMDLKASVNMFKLSKKTKNVKFLFSKCDQLDKYKVFTVQSLTHLPESRVSDSHAPHVEHANQKPLTREDELNHAFKGM